MTIQLPLLLLPLSPNFQHNSSCCFASAQIIDLTSEQFHHMATHGKLDLIIDVRTSTEWDAGHVENATFINSFHQQLEVTPAEEINRTLASLGIKPCLYCKTLVYCGSGARARRALNLLYTKARFRGPLYNGQGTGQWVRAGYELVTDTPSHTAPCMQYQQQLSSGSRNTDDNDDDVPFCARQQGDVVAAPTSTPTPTLSPLAQHQHHQQKKEAAPSLDISSNHLRRNRLHGLKRGEAEGAHPPLLELIW